jgi:uncharacterized membrane protein YfcA
MYKPRFYRHTVPWHTGILPVIIGLAAGIVNGLLGTGGGVIVILTLGALYRQAGGESVPCSPEKGAHPMGDRPIAVDVRHDVGRDIPAASLLAMLPVSILSAVQYAAAGRLELSSFAPLLLPCLIGGVVGGVALDRVRLPLLGKLFSAILIVSGIRMLLG